MLNFELLAVYSIIIQHLTFPIRLLRCVMPRNNSYFVPLRLQEEYDIIHTPDYSPARYYYEDSRDYYS